MRSPFLPVLAAAALAGCLSLPDTGANVPLPSGPPIEGVETPFDAALHCLRGKVPAVLNFAVGQIADTTGREQYADGGTGRLVTQGAGDMVQSALFRAGVSVVNRRDPNIPLAENNWGIRNIRAQIASDFYVSGSITSLDFLPGGGARVELAGVGPRYRQNRILVGLDLALTNAHTGRVVANVSLQKQVFAEEMGFSANRFAGATLVAVDAGLMEREALHHVLRQMLDYATFDLLGQVMAARDVTPCLEHIDPMTAVLGSRPTPTGTGRALREAQEAAAGLPLTPAAEQAQAQAQARPPAPARTSPPEARRLANTATTAAANAIAAGERVRAARTEDEAATAAAEATRFTALAIQALREAAAAGLTGPEGDAAATLVEQAILVVQAANQIAERRRAAEDGTSPPGPSPMQPGAAPPVPPVQPHDRRLGGPGH